MIALWPVRKVALLANDVIRAGSQALGARPVYMNRQPDLAEAETALQHPCQCGENPQLCLTIGPTHLIDHPFRHQDRTAEMQPASFVVRFLCWNSDALR
jgi:hypothetical protein